MEMALPKGEITLKHMVTGLYSRPDNVWCSAGLMHAVTRCEVDASLQPPCTDHFPVVTILDLSQDRVTPTLNRNFRMVDWDAFNQRLKANLKTIPPPSVLKTGEDIQAAAGGITKALQVTIEEEVQPSNPCPHSKRWWNSDLKKMRKDLNKLSAEAMRQRAVPDHPSHEARKNAAREYSKEILKAKKKHWTDFLEEASERDLWTSNRYLKEPVGDGGKSRIPTLKVKDGDGLVREIASNADKAEAFHRVFFPPKPLTSSVPTNFQYPSPLPAPPIISKDRIRKHIRSLSPYKASGPDGIPNVVLQRTVDLIEDYLEPLFQAVIGLGIYVDAWREFTTVVLRKPGKSNYEIPKAHRPIALLCTIAKVLTAIVAEDISYLVEKEALLPFSHYGGRPGRMTTDAVHVLVEKVKSAWRRGKVVSVLFLDVEAAFPNAVTDRLLHNLRRRRILRVYVRFVEQLLKDRRTRMKFDDFVSDLIYLSNGIGQGDPLSMILYILYNADLLEIALAPEEEALGFVDDALVLVEGKTIADNVKALTDFMNREGGGFDWSEGHNSSFALDKLAVTHFTRKRIPDPVRRGRTIPLPTPDLVLRGKTVRVESAYKYLGIYLDSQLRWITQTHEAINKATKWVLLYRRLTKPFSGMSASFMRRLYITVAIPKMTYGLDVWYTPPNKQAGKKRNSGSVKALRELGKLQRMATLAINGALRTSPTDLLDAHAGLLPVDLLLKKICFRSLVRMSSLPYSNPVSRLVGDCHWKPARVHRSNIQQLMECFHFDPTNFVEIPAVSRPPGFQLPMDVLIADSKEEAVEQESRDDANIRIYTDGSCQDGSVGASAVLYYPQDGSLANPARILRCCLGSDAKYSIWDAEAAGMIMAAWLLRGSNRISHFPISIYSDSQALLKSIVAQRASPGFHLVKELTGLLEDLVLRANPVNNPDRIKLRWIAAHKDVKGNEKADEEAKKAAAGNSSPVEHLPHVLRKPLPPSIGVVKHQFLVRLREEWAAAWSRSPRKARVEKLDENFPFDKHRKLIEQLTRIQSSLIFQIRSNHLPLNGYLHRIGKITSKRCDQCWRRRRVDSPETITHFLFECPSYDCERHDLDAKLGRSSRDLKTILADPDKARDLLSYIGRTRRFKDLGDVALMKNTL
jgi:ribonuclease HI